MKKNEGRAFSVGACPDHHSALILVAARLDHIAGTRWGPRRYLKMNLVTEIDREEELAASSSQKKLRKSFFAQPLLFSLTSVEQYDRSA